LRLPRRVRSAAQAAIGGKGLEVLDAYDAQAMTDPEIERLRRRYGR